MHSINVAYMSNLGMTVLLHVFNMEISFVEFSSHCFAILGNKILNKLCGIILPSLPMSILWYVCADLTAASVHLCDYYRLNAIKFERCNLHHIYLLAIFCVLFNIMDYLYFVSWPDLTTSSVLLHTALKWFTLPHLAIYLV